LLARRIEFLRENKKIKNLFFKKIFFRVEVNQTFPGAVLAGLLLLAAFTGARAEPPDAVAAIDTCIARLDPQIDVGYERIARRCPDLAPALEKSGWAAWLPQGWKESRNDLSAGSLKELQALVTRELATHATTRTPRVQKLKEILTDLGATGQERSSAWTRFKKWVRSFFERAGQETPDGWLSRLVSRVGVSGAVIEVVTYIALALVVALAGFIVFNEVRIAGIFRRRDGTREGAGEGALSGNGRITWGDVERAPLLDQPRLLLELIASKLTDLGRLPPARAFTARELVQAADLNEAADREQLNELASTAERVRYAREAVPVAVAESAVSHARELLTRLDSPERAVDGAARS
jgi:hypothetical protein